MGCDTRLVSIQIIVCVSSPRECAANLLAVHLPNDSCLHTASLEGSLSQCGFLHFNEALAPQIDKDTQTHSPRRAQSHYAMLPPEQSRHSSPSLSQQTPGVHASHRLLCEWCAVMLYKHKVCNIVFRCVTYLFLSWFYFRTMLLLTNGNLTKCQTLNIF